MNTQYIDTVLKKMIRSQQKKSEIVAYLSQHKPHLLGSQWREGRIKDCCNILRFCDFANGVTRLYRANFCKYDKFCLACATRRSIKMIQRFEYFITERQLENKHRYHITLTIRHNKKQSLDQLVEKLRTAKDKLAQGFRNSKRNNHKNKSFMNNFLGMVCSIEITYGKNGRHPHIHMLVCGDEDIKTQYSPALATESNRELQKEWYKITKDSYSVGMRRIDVNKDNYSRQGIGEVFKYAIKFSRLEVPQLVEVIDMQYRKQHRFYATYGIFRGINSIIHHDLLIVSEQIFKLLD